MGVLRGTHGSSVRAEPLGRAHTRASAGAFLQADAHIHTRTLSNITLHTQGSTHTPTRAHIRTHARTCNSEPSHIPVGHTGACSLGPIKDALSRSLTHVLMCAYLSLHADRVMCVCMPHTCIHLYKLSRTDERTCARVCVRVQQGRKGTLVGPAWLTFVGVSTRGYSRGTAEYSSYRPSVRRPSQLTFVGVSTRGYSSGPAVSAARPANGRSPMWSQARRGHV